jgi:Tol biopolymer transport system component
MKQCKRLGLVILGAVFFLAGCADSGLITPITQDLGSALPTNTAESSPRLSYDGRYLVFASDRLAQRSIFLYDRQTNRLVPLPGLNQAGVFQDEPDLSADGRYIVYIAQPSGKPDVFVYDRQTLKSQNLTENLLAEVRHPTISGNGRFVAFESDRRGQWDVEIYDRGVMTELSLPFSREKELLK